MACPLIGSQRDAKRARTSHCHATKRSPCLRGGPLPLRLSAFALGRSSGRRTHGNVGSRSSRKVTNLAFAAHAVVAIDPDVLSHDVPPLREVHVLCELDRDESDVPPPCSVEPGGSERLTLFALEMTVNSACDAWSVWPGHEPRPVAHAHHDCKRSGAWLLRSLDRVASVCGLIACGLV